MPKFRKKPVVIEAIQWLGETLDDAVEFVAKNGFPFVARIRTFPEEGLIIPTLEGEMLATKGDWIIKGVKGEFYLCKPDIFAATYEEVIDG